MLKIICLALSLVGCSCGGIQKIRPNVDQTQVYVTKGVQRLVESSVRIRAYCGPELKVDSLGSGVAVGPRHIISARHVAVACQDSQTPDWVSYEAIMDNGATYEIALDRHAKDDDTDVSRFVVLGMATLPVWTELTDYQPAVGQRIWVYAGGGMKQDDAGFWDFILKDGYVSRSFKDIVVISTHGIPGNSGGAIFDEDGRVIGILVSGVWASAHENYVDAYRPTFFPDLWPESIVDLTGNSGP